MKPSLPAVVSPALSEADHGGSQGLIRKGIQVVVLALSLLLAACVTHGPSGVTPPVGPSLPHLPPPGRTDLPPPPTGSMALSYLPGWDQEDHLAGFQAFVEGCGRLKQAAAAAVCQRAKDLGRYRPVSPSDARNFLESHLAAVEVETSDGRAGMLTAYFAPVYPARLVPDSTFDAPVLSRPSNLSQVGDRAAIEAGSAQSQVLAWMKAEDLFFLQIQGSGTLVLADGTRLRAAYAADNGKPFTGIARPMSERGILPPNGTSGDAIRAWLSDHRGPEARAIMALNARYIFFAMSADDGREAVGAAGVPLPARRSIAVDPSHWTYGEPVWIEADAGNLVGARASYRGLVMALDTGSAIRGPVRADLYMGRGDQAGQEAGSVRHPLRMWRLIPRP